MKTLLLVLTFLVAATISLEAQSDQLWRKLAEKIEALHQKVESEGDRMDPQKVRMAIKRIGNITRLLEVGDDPFPPRGEGQLRLNGDGLLQVLHRNEWTGVCDDNFDDTDARVACGQLGGSLIRYQTSQSGPSDTFGLDDLNCNGSESRLVDCPHAGLGTENCGSGEWVKLECDLSHPRARVGALRVTGENKILQVYYNNEWRGVCDDSFDRDDARVACRQMRRALVDFNTGQSGQTGDFWLDDLACTGDENSLKDCRHNGWGSENCGSSEHVQLICE